jgi:hypothetical protein
MTRKKDTALAQPVNADKWERQREAERIHGWQDSQLSIASFYGGITYKGRSYVIAVAEKGAPLVRADVLAREAKERKAADKAAQAQAAKQQEQLI